MNSGNYSKQESRETIQGTMSWQGQSAELCIGDAMISATFDRHFMSCCSVIFAGDARGDHANELGT
eukprot:scaffold191446_cov46-Prasinocladus_malaysianus.AAC.4